jgi:tetratricopeptide (TPR) repeat protein
LGRAAVSDPEGLRTFLRGPLVRPELFAGEAAGRALREAAVLSALGLQNSASQVLEAAAAAGDTSFQLQVQLAAAYEGMGRAADALTAYRRALVIDPDSEVVRGRMTALLVATNRRAEARETLEEVVERQPDNVPAILMLAKLYAESLTGRARCAELARRALDLDPGNVSAQNLMALCGSSGQ